MPEGRLHAIGLHDAFIMTQRYAYHLPQKRIRLMLRNMGAHIPRATFNSFFMSGAYTLLTMLGEAFRSEMATSWSTRRLRPWGLTTGSSDAGT